MRNRTMSLGFPPFTKAVKWLVLINTGVYLLMLVLGVIAPRLGNSLTIAGSLIPGAVMHGWVFQLVTYAFLHLGLFHLLFNMLALWMFGSEFESGWGTKQFLEFYFFCVIGAALTTIAVAYSGVLGVTPLTPTIGSSGGIYGILLAYGVLYGDREILMFPLPFTMKARYMVAIWIFIALVGALNGAAGKGQGVAYFAHLGGALFGWIYIKFMPRRGVQAFFSEMYFGTRNRYYRYKRKQAAKKFEVYMRKHDRADYFDEYGNYRGPGVPDRDKKNGESKSGWVN